MSKGVLIAIKFAITFVLLVIGGLIDKAGANRGIIGIVLLPIVTAVWKYKSQNDDEQNKE